MLRFNSHVRWLSRSFGLSWDCLLHCLAASPLAFSSLRPVRTAPAKSISGRYHHSWYQFQKRLVFSALVGELGWTSEGVLEKRSHYNIKYEHGVSIVKIDACCTIVTPFPIMNAQHNDNQSNVNHYVPGEITHSFLVLFSPGSVSRVKHCSIELHDPRCLYRGSSEFPRVSQFWVFCRFNKHIASTQCKSKLMIHTTD